MGLSSELSCEAGNFSCCRSSHRLFQSEALSLYFPTLESWVAWSVSLPSCSSWIICTQVWDRLTLQLPPCCESFPPWLAVSAPPTSLDECFFFNSLVVRFPYSSIFWQFWLFIFLNLLLSLFWLCEEAKYNYLCLHLGQKCVLGIFKGMLRDCGSCESQSILMFCSALFQHASKPVKFRMQVLPHFL